MLRTIACLAVAAACLLFPARVIAGGPSWLCLPIDGVTEDNAKTCAALLGTKLGDKLWPQDRGVHIRQRDSQWYLTFYLKNVALSDVETAFQGSGFSIPRDKLRLFGHVFLEFDIRQAPRKELLADLEALPHLSVFEAEESRDNRLRVLVDMPYPGDGDRDRDLVALDTFRRNNFASDPATRSEPPATPQTLPGYDAFRDIAARHKGSLKDIWWSAAFGCRPLGGVAAAPVDAASPPR
jgi:hypothetical protein